MSENRSTARVPVDAYFWGVWPGDSSGHALHDTEGHSVSRFDRKCPWTDEVLDNHWLQDDINGMKQLEGVATVIFCADWTAIAFWDRSGDSRGDSRAVFCFKGQLNFHQAVEHIRAYFPSVFARFTFTIVPWQKANKKEGK